MHSEDHEEWVRQSLKWIEGYYNRYDPAPPTNDFRTPKSQATIDELKRKFGVQ
jgi:hypothetical protein